MCFWSTYVFAEGSDERRFLVTYLATFFIRIRVSEQVTARCCKPRPRPDPVPLRVSPDNIASGDVPVRLLTFLHRADEQRFG